MSGDAALGTVLRGLRTDRGLGLATIALRAHCSAAQLSRVETGERTLRVELARALDEIYGTGTVIVSLLQHHPAPASNGAAAGVSPDRLLHVQLPGGGGSVLVSRRHVLAALGVGLLADPAIAAFEHAVARIEPGPELLASYASALAGYQLAARAMAPARMLDAMIGKIAVLDLLRRRTTGSLRRDYLELQARYAESVSWLSEEAGQDTEAVFWLDRAAEWAQIGGWTAMSGYVFVRRSMLAISCGPDSAQAGLRAVDHAQTALTLPGTPRRIRGLAAKQAAFGHALARDADSSARALDTAMDLLDDTEDTSGLGQRSVPGDELRAIFWATCDTYLGRGAAAIDVLRPRLATLTAASPRTAAITRGKVAYAMAAIGEPGEAVRLARSVLDAGDQLQSRSASNEIRRAATVLQRWHRDPEVADLLRRVPLRSATSA